MDSMQLWARDDEAVRQAIELGEMAHIETASEELTDEFLLFAIESGLLKTWATAFPDPRREPEIGMEVILPAHLAARFAGLYSMRKAGYVLRSARVLGAPTRVSSSSSSAGSSPRRAPAGVQTRSRRRSRRCAPNRQRPRPSRDTSATPLPHTSPRSIGS